MGDALLKRKAEEWNERIVWWQCQYALDVGRGTDLSLYTGEGKCTLICASWRAPHVSMMAARRSWRVPGSFTGLWIFNVKWWKIMPSLYFSPSLVGSFWYDQKQSNNRHAHNVFCVYKCSYLGVTRITTTGKPCLWYGWCCSTASCNAAASFILLKSALSPL